MGKSSRLRFHVVPQPGSTPLLSDPARILRTTTSMRDPSPFRSPRSGGGSCSYGAGINPSNIEAKIFEPLLHAVLGEDEASTRFHRVELPVTDEAADVLTGVACDAAEVFHSWWVWQPCDWLTPHEVSMTLSALARSMATCRACPTVNSSSMLWRSEITGVASPLLWTMTLPMSWK